MKLLRIRYARPQSTRALVRDAILYGATSLVLLALIWLSLETGSFPSRRGLSGGIGKDTPLFFYLVATVYGLMCLLTGWCASHAVLTLIRRLRGQDHPGVECGS
jgi:hypothetical protein